MRVIVTGPTGTAGLQVLRAALEDPEIHAVTAIARRPPPVSHAKLVTLVHRDFLDYSAILPRLDAHDAVLWCLGVSQTQVNREEYHRITYDFAIAAAQALKRVNPSIVFCFLSGGGADTTEKSRILFARVKGKTENALDRVGLARVHHFRPAYIRPARDQPKKGLADGTLNALSPLLRLVAPNSVVDASDLARAMIEVAKHGGPHVVENREIRRIAEHVKRKSQGVA